MVNKLHSASELRSDIRLVMVLPEWKSYFFQNLDINKPSHPSCSISPNHFQNPIQQLWFYKCAVSPTSSVKKKQEQLKSAKHRGNCSVMRQGTWCYRSRAGHVPFILRKMLLRPFKGAVIFLSAIWKLELFMLHFCSWKYFSKYFWVLSNQWRKDPMWQHLNCYYWYFECLQFMFAFATQFPDLHRWGNRKWWNDADVGLTGAQVLQIQVSSWV